MSIRDPLLLFAQLSATPGDAVRWACVLEATSPKPGNVFPGRPFTNLRYLDFVVAAEVAAECFSRGGRISQRMLEAVLETQTRCQSNVNLGILLLLGPLVAADEHLTETGRARIPESSDVEGCSAAAATESGQRPCELSSQVWKAALARQLACFDDLDGRNVFRAIASASAGSLGTTEAMDVNRPHDAVDLIAAMQLASDRDRIARQYATGFADLLDHIVPLIRDSILGCGDVLQGISAACVRLLAEAPDSLIARKNGIETAIAVQSLAQSVDPSDGSQLLWLDAALRDPQNKRNPGTTADLIAAGLYVLLRSGFVNSQFPSHPNQRPA